MTKPNRFPPLDLIHTPLEGVNLAEASAGTGKTYAISALFVRLIVAHRLNVDEILVVTFTEAATEELKDRIRNRLGEALRAFQGKACGDAFLNDLVEQTGDPKGAAFRLKEALRAFDQAGIYTIHGFCRRILHDNAFESGRLFDTELVAEVEDLKAEVIRDFWRRHFYGASPRFVNYALRRGFGPAALQSLLSDSCLDPNLTVIPSDGGGDIGAADREYVTAFEGVKGVWPGCRDAVKTLLLNSEALKRNMYRPQSIPEWMDAMDRYVRRGAHDPVLFPAFERFTRQGVEGAVKKNCAVPVHPFFEVCQTLKEAQDFLAEAFEGHLVALKRELLYHGAEELAKRKGERNIISFYDLLLGVHDALEKEGGETLAAAVRRRYKAALIDEFQDTDPLQYGLFRRLFALAPGVDRQGLFFIGDPKQAIYGFRGADVFAYMAAARRVDAAYTLGENWRSEPALVEAVNTLFSRIERPFIYEEIPFQSVSPADQADGICFTLDGEVDAPLQLWFLNARKHGAGDSPLTRTAAREAIMRATTAEISRLLRLGREGRARIGGRSVREADIAVLVRTNAEAGRIQAVLSASGIASVVYTSDDLFASAEAEEMERILRAVTEPTRPEAVMAALATDILGCRAKELDDMLTGEGKWEAWVLEFTRYHELWRSRGFMAMFRRLLVDRQVLVRLMAFDNGERRNTNVGHLCEVLHQAAFENRLGMSGLLKWLQERRHRQGALPEEHQLRLESDEDAVKLVTIHKSKGLEYPIVFCPFLWEGPFEGGDRSTVFFHDAARGMTKTLDLGSERMADHARRAEEEDLAEDLRLLYVALTRARNRCYTVWGRIRGCGRSAAAYLFHGGGTANGGDVVGALQERFEGLSDEDVFEALNAVAREAAGAVGLSDMPAGAPRPHRSASREETLRGPRRFGGRIDRRWGISSFSAIASAREADSAAGAIREEWDEVDEVSVTPDVGSPDTVEKDIFDFPAGAAAGTCIHSIFEALDFSADSSAVSPLVAQKLAAFGFDAAWTAVVSTMVNNVLAVCLPGKEGSFTLSEIGLDERLTELAFYFPVSGLSRSALERALVREARLGGDGYSALGTDGPPLSPSEGYMRGFVDMAFRHDGWYYIVDWKSNLLGSKVTDYDESRLHQEMVEALYTVQYLIYTVALDRYLAVRIPDYDYDRHFGGVFYLFVRGMDPRTGHPYGVYRARPDKALIRELSEKMGGG